MSLSEYLSYAWKAKNLFLAVRKTINTVENIRILKEFYSEYPYANHEDGMRFLNIIQAGTAIEKHNCFDNYNHKPIEYLSEPEKDILNYYYSYINGNFYNIKFNKSCPPDLTRHILYLERRYGYKILK